ncbi:hypothetical protein DICVIV_12193 [Dictyocaulus viviparus]|uniref:Cuticlin N-terminal domain-containing protein n=1 Tax=Dictyocaulus viviparus TaxID=29172 RepID=A0A0D8XHM4_DICVI|nr:hypothetical protein DICVIV_12193 [Dictyocaulus viviparus]
MCLLRHVLICSAVFNLITFLIGLFLGILHEDLVILSLVLTIVGLLGMVLFAVTWCIRPKAIHRPIYFVKHWKEEKPKKDATINPDITEAIMRNIRGIPFLIQAIQYSMEATYYRDVLSEMGESVVRTSVIHTAPACTSILDSESEDEGKDIKFTPSESNEWLKLLLLLEAVTYRHSAEEQWLPIGESWRNEQLRLSLGRGSTNLLVFPYCETSPRGERGGDAVEHDFSRIESIKRNHRHRHKTAGNHQQLQMKYILFVMLASVNAMFSKYSIDNEIVGDPTVECEDSMVGLTFKTKRPFSGRVYVYGMAGDNKCSKAFVENHNQSR